MDTVTATLAGRAATLSTTLYAVSERCGHDTVVTEISGVADELILISTTLWRLHEAVAVEEKSYTAAFKTDLEEITTELGLLFDEIEECGTELQKADSGPGNAVAWFFKKGRVTKLQKHLEALKTTLVVMRTVLYHGKDYGTYK